MNSSKLKDAVHNVLANAQRMAIVRDHQAGTLSNKLFWRELLHSFRNQLPCIRIPSVIESVSRVPATAYGADVELLRRLRPNVSVLGGEA